MHDLATLGWTSFFQDQLDPATDAGLVPARVIEEQRRRCRLLAESGELEGEVTGRMRHEAQSGGLMPVTGDWVLARVADAGRAVVQRVLRRRTQFSRRAAGKREEEQIVATNVDVVFLVQSLDRDFNARRIERYMTLLWESGAQPVVLLSKSDLCGNPDAFVGDAVGVASGAPVHVVSAVDEGGLLPLDPYLAPGRTCSFVGSSGVGKSTIVNRLAGQELMPTGGLRADGRGRHTTTTRRIHVLPGRGLLLDTPGMREIGLWEGELGISQAFPEIEQLGEKCRFRDCSHEAEPGCAVRHAVQAGDIPESRYESFLKLRAELNFEARRADPALRAEERRRWRAIHKSQRSRPDKREV
ncbi:MAG: ribosome small subunit-dependent GTPase A [Candidatus Eisenbacteria bacterium]|nr:ribosome small subunit-dependent GTPase A [Candidatus Eisenbacteria bacterium]